jgi:hypothetical protein
VNQNVSLDWSFLDPAAIQATFDFQNRKFQGKASAA